MEILSQGKRIKVIVEEGELKFVHPYTEETTTDINKTKEDWWFLSVEKEKEFKKFLKRVDKLDKDKLINICKNNDERIDLRKLEEA